MMLMNRTALALTLISVFFIWSVIEIKFANAQFLGSVYINPDGSVTGTTKIQRNENIYTLTGNISGGIQIQTSHILLDGSGYAVEGNGEGRGIDLSNGRGQDPSRPEINNVTVMNLKILNFYYGVDNANTNNNTFIGNYIENCLSFWIVGSSNNIITNNTMNNASISINYAGSNNITRNNFISCWVTTWASTQPIVDGNYWSDYKTRYPDAKEIDNSGIWNMPYESWENVIDSHPLVMPYGASPVSSSSPTPEPTPEVEAFPTTFVIATSVIFAIVCLALLVYFKKRQKARDKV